MRSEEFDERIGTKRAGVRRYLVFTRQILRGAPSYVVHDPVTFKNHIFDPLEYRILTQIVRTATLSEVFDGMVRDGHLEAAERDDFYRFVIRAHEHGLLQMAAEDAAALYERHARKTAARRRGLLRWFVYYKIPLVDPDRFLDRTVGLLGRLSRAGFALWGALVALAFAMCWGEFGRMFGETANLLTLANVPVMYVALVVLKGLHEFGHGYACKRFGCEVPEMGMIMIFGTPCAYVDASASWKLENRWHRIVIGLAGMYVEIAVAAIFALVWAGTPSGLLHDIAINVIVLASFVTLLFNINPLMRFDGYYVLTDLLGMPNLWERSKRFVESRAKRLFLGLRGRDEPKRARERALYSVYGLAAVAYKALLAVAIIAMVLMDWPLLGTALGIAFGYTFLLSPLIRLVRYLLSHPETKPVRWRARGVAVVGVFAVPAALCLAPVSKEIIAPGVLEPERSVVMRAPVAGFVAAIDVTEGESLAVGDRVASLENRRLAIQLTHGERELRAEAIRLAGAELVDPAMAAVYRSRVALLEERLDRLRRENRSLQLHATEPGVVTTRWTEPGRFVGVGEPVAEIHCGRPLLRMVLTDHDVQRASLAPGDRLELRWGADPARTVYATVRDVSPSASRDSVPDALTVLGGGAIYGVPRLTASSLAGLRAEQPYSQVVLVPEWVPVGRSAGWIARVRVPAETETVGGWLLRHLAGFYHSWRMG